MIYPGRRIGLSDCCESIVRIYVNESVKRGQMVTYRCVSCNKWCTATFQTVE